MQISQARALREAATYLEPLSPALDLCHIAAYVFGRSHADEEAAADIVRAGQDLMERHRSGEMADIGFFLVTWGAEAIATMRIAAGDFGIDETLRRLQDAPGGDNVGDDDGWQAMVAEYRALADEILIDTLNEFREFEAVILFSGKRAEYLRRRAVGMAALIEAVGPTAPRPC